MRTFAIGSFLAAVLFCPMAFAANYSPPAGYLPAPESFGGDVFAVAPDGKVAVSTQGDTQVRVYASAAAAQVSATPVQTFNIPAAKFWGDFAFDGNDTLLMSEDSGVKGVLSGSIASGTVSNLGPVPNVQGVVAHGGAVYAVAVNGPGTNAIYRLAGGTATPVLSNIGVGYLGGIAFDPAGNLLVTDSNDPNFTGNAGKVLRFNTTLAALGSIDLTGGNGSGAYDLALDPAGDIFVSTNATITEIPHGTTTAEQFGGTFSDNPSLGFTFVSGLDFSGIGFDPNTTGTGRLWINGTDTADGNIIGVQTPEPAGLALMGIAAAGLLLRKGRRMVASSITVLATVAAIEGSLSTARGDQFFATQVVATTVNGSPSSFTNPSLALGAPQGAGDSAGSTDVYSLTSGGSITLAFDDNNPTSHRYIYDGPGPDFLVSENAFYQNEDPHRSFAELMFVEVSTDGVNFQRFTNYSTTPGPVGPFGVIDPDDVAGFAGVNPVYANPTLNTINPFQVGAAGGDVFDLHSLQYTPLVQSGVVDLAHIRFMRLIDVIGDGSEADSFGRPIYDPTGPSINGADVDAVTVINGVHAPEPAIALPVAALALLARNRQNLNPLARYPGRGQG